MPKEIKEDIYDTTVEYSAIVSNIGLYDKELDTWKINQGNIELAKEQGENRKSIEIAKKMLADNISIEQISKFTGVSIDELEKLKNNINL